MSRRLGSLAGFAVVVVCAAGAAAQTTPTTTIAVLQPTAEPPPATPSSCDEFSCYKRAVLDGNRFAAVGQGYTGVYVFVRNAGEWAIESVLPVPEPSVYGCTVEGCEPPDPMDFDPDFGLALALDGDALLVSHVHYDQPSETRDARVYVYHRYGSTWRHTQTIDDGCFSTSPLVAERGTAFLGTCAYERSRFGQYRFVQQLKSADGLAFGSPAAFDGSTAVFGGDGGVYLFERFRFGWRQVQKLADSAADTGFGSALAVDGDTIAVGAPSEPGAVPERPGAVHVFTRRVWGFRQTQVLTNPFPYGESEERVFRPFGTAVAVDSGRLIASGEVLYPFADPMPMNYLYQQRWGRFAATAALNAGGAHAVSIDRRWALVDSDGLRTGTYPALFALP